MWSSIYTAMDNDRKRLLFHCTHMGMMENDVLFGSFARAHIESLSSQDVQDLEAVLTNNDMDLFKWASAKVSVPDEWDTPVMRKLIEFCRDSQT